MFIEIKIIAKLKKSCIKHNCYIKKNRATIYCLRNRNILTSQGYDRNRTNKRNCKSDCFKLQSSKNNFVWLVCSWKL